MAATRTRRSAAKKTPAKKTAAKKPMASREPTAAQVNKLNRFAHEINTRLEKAENMDGKANDHRLAAAIQLSNAKDLCKEAGVAFKKWCEENVEWSYDTARKLVRIGASSNPELALEDLRSRTAMQQRESRERAKTKATAAKKTAAAVTQSPQAAIDHVLSQVPEDKAIKVLEKAAKTRGVQLPKDDFDAGDLGDLRHAVAAYDALDSAVDKLHLLDHVAKDTGAEVFIFDQPIADAVAAAEKKSKPTRKRASKANGASKPAATKPAASRRRRSSARAAA